MQRPNANSHIFWRVQLQAHFTPIKIRGGADQLETGLCRAGSQTFRREEINMFADGKELSPPTSKQPIVQTGRVRGKQKQVTVRAQTARELDEKRHRIDNMLDHSAGD